MVPFVTASASRIEPSGRGKKQLCEIGVPETSQIRGTGASGSADVGTEAWPLSPAFESVFAIRIPGIRKWKFPDIRVIIPCSARR